MSTKHAMTGIPSYRRHKPSGQAVVTLNGVDRARVRPGGNPRLPAEPDPPLVRDARPAGLRTRSRPDHPRSREGRRDPDLHRNRVWVRDAEPFGHSSGSIDVARCEFLWRKLEWTGSFFVGVHLCRTPGGSPGAMPRHLQRALSWGRGSRAIARVPTGSYRLTPGQPSEASTQIPCGLALARSDH